MSKHYAEVKDFYECNLWSDYMVWNAVHRWITVNEYQEITGVEYESKKE